MLIRSAVLDRRSSVTRGSGGGKGWFLRIAMASTNVVGRGTSEVKSESGGAGGKGIGARLGWISSGSIS